MSHTLPTLKYEYSDLEPHIDTETMITHHSKHHQTYVDNLNKALENHPELQNLSLENLLKDLGNIPEEVRTPIKNNGGGHYNHSLFWEVMSKNPKPISGKLKLAIETKWGSIETFKEIFSNTALTTFGSGWAWLCLNSNKELEIISTQNQDTPLSTGLIPILTIDVWEHAYYLKYKNKRVDYIKAWIENVACGEKMEEIYLKNI